jgi:rhodanese-related sulfurtransferase
MGIMMKKGKNRFLICLMLAAILISPAAALAGKNVPKETKGHNVVITKELLHRERLATDRSLYISPEDALAKLKNRDTVFVDVRSNEDFKQYRIPEFINLPLYAIKTKGFLKGRYLVLMNEGTSYSVMEQESRKLKELGLNPWILQGGLNYWYQIKNPVEGDMIALKGRINEMSPQNALNETVYDRWVVVNISDSSNSKISSYFPESISIPYSRKSFMFSFSIKNKLSQYKDPAYSILVVDENTDNYLRVEKILKDAGFHNVFFLRGAVRGYEGVLKTQALSWERGNTRTITTKKCKTCS